MTLLNITIDTEDLGIDDEGYGKSFEDLFNEALEAKITKRVVENVTSGEVGQYSIKVQENIKTGVNALFENLLNEDIVITDRYGSKEFVGSVEDFIKKEIDDKYLHPVDNHGKRLQGCTSSGTSWIQWHLQKRAETYVDNEIKRSMGNIERTIDRTITKTVGSFTDKIIEKKVTEKLLKVGIALNDIGG